MSAHMCRAAEAQPFVGPHWPLQDGQGGALALATSLRASQIDPSAWRGDSLILGYSIRVSSWGTRRKSKDLAQGASTSSYVSLPHRVHAESPSHHFDSFALPRRLGGWVITGIFCGSGWPVVGCSCLEDRDSTFDYLIPLAAAGPRESPATPHGCVPTTSKQLATSTTSLQWHRHQRWPRLRATRPSCRALEPALPGQTRSCGMPCDTPSRRANTRLCTNTSSPSRGRCAARHQAQAAWTRHCSQGREATTTMQRRCGIRCASSRRRGLA